MTAPKSNDEDDPSGPQTSQSSSPAKKHAPSASTGSTPAPKASKDGTTRATPGAQRPRSATTRSHPTLLSDFLLGRPSPARVAADRQAAREAAQARRLSLEMVKQEMRQAAVMRVQAPGGVHDRVKKWQKANLAAMASADPFATPSEPSEMNIQVEDESVTEEDRMRIKARQKKPAPKIIAGRKTDGGDSSKGSQEDLKPSSPPKKRVVSDTNWMKNKKKSPSRSRSPKAKANENNGSPLPKDFLARTAANPSVSKKVKDWASKVEVPSEVSSNRHSIPGRPKSSCSGDGIRVRPIPSENDNASGRSSARITVKSNGSRKAKEPEGDGIRVRPIPSEKDTASERTSEMTQSSGVTSAPSTPRASKAYEDDGIRIRPGPSDNSTTTGTSDSTRTVEVPMPLKQKSQESNNLKPQATRKQTQRNVSPKNKSRQASTSKYQARVSSHTQESDGANTVRASSRQSSRRPSTHGTSTHRDPSPSEMEVVEDLKPEGLRIPTRKSSKGPLKKEKDVERPISKSHEDTATVMTEDVSDSESWSSDSVSDMPFSDLQQTLADIPVGYSAFSELDLGSGSKRRNARPKTKRQPSFKGATNVLKKALTEGKKILTEKVEHPKPVVNQPPNIETWLKATLDPFVDSSSIPEPEHNQKPEDERIDENNTWHSTSSKPKPKPAYVTSPSDFSKSEGTAESRETEKPEFEEPSRAQSTTPTPAGLKRSRATRLSSTPSKSSSKKGLKEKLIDAFRGESTGHSPPPLEYPSCPEVVDLDEEREHEHRERHRSSGARRSSSPDDYDSSESSELTQTAPSPISSKRKPPTNGFHELSTIISEESRTTFPSELSSVVSQSTITESTNLTRSSALSRKRSQKPGLKRRLTKHSDLISVLSLPDDTSGPPRTRSRRSTRCVRRPSTRLGSATINELLLEFEDDEDLYLRELKTLVDGVIPVLLTQFVNKNNRARKDLFGSPPQKYKEDTLDNAVVNMGIALDSLRNHHRLCPPLTDLHRLTGWLESVHSIYNNYLDVWRLGFQGIIVNLAPKSFDDADSLINAMPRNEQGDVLNEDGDRIDVAHLLKRPLVRIKWIAKFIKGYQSIAGTRGLESLVSKWEALQEKAKRRHKEENARVVDEDAKNSDTSRTRDLRTLEALENVKVDRFRQVYAKDTFDLDLRHSNGQRLECQVELIIRDNQVFKSDPGDLLIREAGNSGRSWLLFAPVLGGRFSARAGDHKHQLVVMIRGSRDEWFELLSLTTDNEEQVLDWLNMLGHAPIPPAIKEPTSSISQPMVPSPKSAAYEIPLGESKLGRKLVLSRTSTKPAENLEEPTTPTFSHNQSPPTTPTSTYQTGASTPSPEKTPTQDSYLKYEHRSDDVDEAYSQSYEDHDDPAFKKSSPNSTPYRGDGAPPPPVHRSFGSKKAPVLSPPVDQNTARIKRRTSSPLKHEYHPSDVSSEGSTSPISGSEDEDSVSDESSDDELEAVDIPDTTPAISIKKDTKIPTASIYSESTASIPPSLSASREDVSKSEVQQPDYVIKSVASISYWDNKHGRWQDLWPDLCSIVTTPGLIEAYPYRRTHSSSGGPGQEEPPLIALDLTPLVMLRNSTVVDLEIRSPVLSYSRLYAKVVKYETSFFRFRVQSVPDCESLYTAVHRARMDNAKYKALEEETRVRAFGQYQNQEAEGDGNSQRRSWFGRKNSYRASARAPSQSAGSTSQSSGISASSFLRKLMGGGNQSFNIAMSSVDRPARFGSRDASLYTSSSSSATPPRSPSVSAANSGSSKMSLTTNNLKVRLHLLISASKWEDHGNCFLEVTRPDRGTRQNLRKYQGMEKRIIVTTIPKKDTDKPAIVLDVILGSQCFSQLGSRGVLINVWEEVKDESGQTGVAPQGGGSGGNVRKWCFQCSSVAQARWIFGLVTQEVVIG